MAQIKPSFEDFPGTNWKLLGEAEFPIGINTAELVHTWLVDTLRALNLEARFLDKILASAQLAVERNIQPLDGQDCDHAHVLIFTSVGSPSTRQPWGFFRVEKKGDPPTAIHNFDHAIVFYLYQDVK